MPWLAEAPMVGTGAPDELLLGLGDGRGHRAGLAAVEQHRAQPRVQQQQDEHGDGGGADTGGKATLRQLVGQRVPRLGATRSSGSDCHGCAFHPDPWSASFPS